MQYERNFYQIRSNEEILKDLKKEIKTIGYYSLPYENVSDIEDYSSAIKQENIFIVGIGGSTLGTKAIYKFLKTTKKFKKRLLFLDTIDPIRINYLLSLCDLKDAHFILISKSGDTIEPISILKYLINRLNLTSHNATVITSEKTSLHQFANSLNIKTFLIKYNVGGRFSVFSPVGLVPLSAVGVNIKDLLNGCKEVHESFFNKDYYYDLIINKARFLVENKSRFRMNIIFSYSSVFQDFNKWFVQLWAESLGKKNINGTRQGLTPISLLGPDDQHSFLQLIIDGVRDKTVTIFKINDLKDESLIPDSCSGYFESNYLKDISFNELINLQADSTYEAIMNESDIPCDKITIETINENNIAKLMYRFQLLTSSVGAFLQVNTYDQPAVELGKSILRNKFDN